MNIVILKNIYSIICFHLQRYFAHKMAGISPLYDVGVVGAGAYGTAVLGQLSLRKIPKEQHTLRILVVERSTDLGPGMPYSKYMTIPEHIVNIAGGCTQITATYIPYSERSDFLVWLRSLSPEYRVSLGIESSESPNWLYKPFPRFVVGLYLSDRFNHFLKTLVQKGFTVDVLKQTTVHSVSPTKRLGLHCYQLELNGKTSVYAKSLFIATGHWTHNRFPEFPCWIPSPFPPQAIQKRTNLGANIGILGCSLSAIDTALTLSAKNGSFRWTSDNGEMNLKFQPFIGAEEFKMTMYGRKAMLPQVMGVVVNKIFSYKYLTPASFIPVIEANEGFLPLDDFWRLLKREIYDEVPRLRAHLPVDWETMSLEEAVSKMRAFLQATDPIERLSHELKAAKESLKTGVPLLLQNVFYQSYAIFDEALNYFSAEDRIRFEAIKTELHLLIGPFPIQNAKKILALMRGGYLNIKRIGTEYEIEEAPNKTGIKVSWRLETDLIEEAKHDVMIDATGQKAAFEKDSSDLTSSLRKHKLLKEVLVSFRDGREAQKHQDHPSVVKRDGVPYFRASGALIDINNFSLVSANETLCAPIYYMGPFTMGQVAFPQDMSVVTTAAERAVGDLVTRGVLEPDDNYAVEKDPMPMYGWFSNAKGDLTGDMAKMSRILTSKRIKV